LRPAPLVVTTRRLRPGDVHKLQLQLPAACEQPALITGWRCRRPDPVNTGIEQLLDGRPAPRSADGALAKNTPLTWPAAPSW